MKSNPKPDLQVEEANAALNQAKEAERALKLQLREASVNGRF